MSLVCSTISDIGFDAKAFKDAVLIGIKQGKIIPPEKPPRGQRICQVCFGLFIRDTKAQINCKKCRYKKKKEKADARKRKAMGSTAQAK